MRFEAAPVKGLLRAFEKIVLDYKSDAAMITDLVRGKLLCSSMQDVIKTIEVLVAADPSLSRACPARLWNSETNKKNEKEGRDALRQYSRILSAENVTNYIEIVFAKNRIGTARMLKFRHVCSHEHAEY